MSIAGFWRSVVTAMFVLTTHMAWATDDIERPPIEYSRQAPDNAVSRLQSRLDAEEFTLKYDDKFGFLPALLSALEVPVESQMLVFSKTSLQRDKISPSTPRAIYFNDDAYIGFCQSGKVLEISAVDPELGAVFYTLEQAPATKPTIRRQLDNCMICHSSSRTGGVPGHLVRSLAVDASGEPIYSEGSVSVDHTTPFDKRWGGWYVTGTHGAQSHLGNLTFADRNIAKLRGQNVVELSQYFRTQQYLSPHSDIVALMILEHQTHVHNQLTKANYAARQALHYEAELNRALGEPEGNRLDSTTRRIQNAGDELIDALLLVGEAPLTAPISGPSDYAKVFAQGGPRDREGRSLRDFDLHRRLFTYPCSYAIYSPAFDGLPEEMRSYVWKKLWDILTGELTTQKYSHLSSQDKDAIVGILRDTKQDLPDYWKRE